MDDEPGIARSAAHAPPEPWSHNLRYHRVILDAVLPGSQDARFAATCTGGTRWSGLSRRPSPPN